MILISYKIDLFDVALKRHTKFDVLIQSTSAEERSLRTIEILRKAGTKFDKNLVFCFNEVISRSGLSRDYFLAKYCSGNGKASPFDCRLLDVENGINSFCENLRSNKIITAEKKILIDISTFIKPYFFCLLKLLVSEYNMSEIYVTYTEPVSYGKPLDERITFTRGLDHVGEIPSFNGFTDIDKKNMLIIMLGFEGQRALEVLRSVQPDKTLVINGFPAYRSEFKDVSLIHNISAITEGECLPELQLSSASDPFEAFRAIKRIHDDWSKSYNLSIAPLGTKPMALGACLFALQNESTRILYAYPQGYVQKVAEGCGKTWLYEIFFK
jgi:hypothetical protein